MLVPWSVITPVDLDSYHAEAFEGLADMGFRNTFYTLKLRIENLIPKQAKTYYMMEPFLAFMRPAGYTHTGRGG